MRLLRLSFQQGKSKTGLLSNCACLVIGKLWVDSFVKSDQTTLKVTLVFTAASLLDVQH